MELGRWNEAFESQRAVFIEAFADAVLLLVVLSPGFCFLVFRPVPIAPHMSRGGAKLTESTSFEFLVQAAWCARRSSRQVEGLQWAGPPTARSGTRTPW